MRDLTPEELQAGIDALHTCRAQNRPDNFTVVMIYRAILEAGAVREPVQVQVIGTGGGPDDDHANPVTDQEAR